MSFRYFIQYSFIALIALSVLTGSKRPMLTRITINSADSLVSTWAVATDKNIKTKTGTSYFWYYNNIIHFTDGGYSGKLLHGTYVSKFPNGQLKIYGQFKYGVKEGEWKQWYANGNIKEIAEYSNGVMHGKHILYNTSNATIIKHYKHGSIHTKKNHRTTAKDTSVHKQNSGGNKHVKKTDSIDKRSRSKKSRDSLERNVERTDTTTKLKSKNRPGNKSQKDSLKHNQRNKTSHHKKADSIRRK